MYPSLGARTRRVRRIHISRALLAVVAIAAQVAVFGQATRPGTAQAAPAIAQTYYTPYEAQQYIGILRTIADDPACCDSPVISTISITSGADGNVVYYDHFEDGYEVDALSPVQASTLVLPMDAGEVWTQTSNVSVDVGGARGAGNYFDGRDKIVSTAPIAVTQTGYASDSGTLLAGGVQVLDIDKSGTRFDIPAGEDADFNQVFEYTGLVVVGTAAGTTVSADLDANGSYETSFSLTEGETHVVNGGVLLGAVVTANQPVSVYVTTGDIGATYESRLFELYPTAIWSDQSVSPVGSYSGTLGTRVFLFNPGAGGITVDVLLGGGGIDTVPVGAHAQASYLMPVDAGARFTSQGGEPFYAFQMITTEGSSTSSYDWGYTLVPGQATTPSVIVPYAPGSEGLTNNYSPVWLAPSADTTLYVDRDGDPTTGAGVDALGNHFDFSCDVTAFASITIYDDGTSNCYLPSESSAAGGDRDLTGARFYTLDGTRLAAAWGQRPGYTGGSPALDMGTTILPFPEIIMTKSSVISDDGDGDGLADAGDEITYTVTMQNLGIVAVDDVVLTDDPPTLTSYVASSTILDGATKPDDGAPFSPTPLDADSPAGGLAVGTIGPGATRVAEFAVVVDSPIPFGVSEVVNTAIMVTDYGPTTATNRRPLDVPPLHIVKSSSVGGGVVGAGDPITYTVRVHNSEDTPQTGVVVTDTLPVGVSYVGGSVAADVAGTPVAAGPPPNLVSGVTIPDDGMLTITFDVTVDSPIPGGTTEFVNTAETYSDQFPAPQSASATDYAETLADLSLTKVDDEVTPLHPGDRLAYTLTVTNAGPDAAVAVVVVDTLPPSVTFVPAASDPSCVEGPVGTLTCLPGDLGVTSVAFDIAVDVGSAVDGVINNTATLSSDTPEGNPGDETDDEGTVVDVPPSISVVKDVSSDWVTEPGETVTFFVTVTNDSIEDVTLTALTDDRFGDLADAGNPAVSANTCPVVGTAIAVGDALSCQFDGFVPGNASGPPHQDVVLASVIDDDGSTDSASDDATVFFLDTASTIAVTKAPSTSSVDEPGDDVTFDVTVTNTSAETLTIDSLVDDVFGDLLDVANPDVSANSCVSLPTTMAAGAAFACSFEAFVAGDASGPDHTDTVTVTGHDDEGDVARDEASATVSFDDVLPAASITKTTSAASVTEPGGTVTFTVTVENLSVEPLTVDALWDDVFGDVLDAGNTDVAANTCPTLPSSLAAGATATCSFQAALTGRYGDPDHVDTVTVTADDEDGNDIEESDSATVAFAPSGSSLTGVVFADLDRDGVMDPGEPGLAGIGVQVTDSGGGGTVTVTTPSNGHWSATVLPGSVDVRVVDATVPAGYDLTTANAHQTVTAVAGVAVPAADIGYGPPPGSISGQVYLDLDHDPSRDPGEPPRAGVTVDLYQSGAVVHSTVTDGEGHYFFANLAPGTYEVRIDRQTALTGLEISIDPDAAVDGRTAAMVIAGSVVNGLDFGYTGTASVGDLVWEDRDSDGNKNEDEPTLAGATITMTWAGPDGVFDTADDYVFPSVITDEFGHYEFATLPPGSYRLEVDSATIGAATHATTPTVMTIDLTAGNAVLTADFGFELEAALPFTGIAADQFLIAAAVLLLLGAAVLVDGHRRERRWDLAIWRVSGRR